MKTMILMVTTFMSVNLLANDTTFKCRADGQRGQNYVETVVSSAQAIFDGVEFKRDRSFRGTGKYLKYTATPIEADGADTLMVPKTLVQNRVNQGIIRAFNDGKRTLFSCQK
jgi:aspartate/glutamate racemase